MTIEWPVRLCASPILAVAGTKPLVHQMYTSRARLYRRMLSATERSRCQGIYGSGLPKAVAYAARNYTMLSGTTLSHPFVYAPVP